MIAPVTGPATDPHAGVYDVTVPASGTATAAVEAAAVLPARPIAAQAHAMRAAAALVERAGVAGLSVVVDDDRITIQVPSHLAGSRARAEAVAVLATALGTRPARDTRGDRGWITADGDLAGHIVRVFTRWEDRP